MSITSPSYIFEKTENSERSTNIEQYVPRRACVSWSPKAQVSKEEAFFASCDGRALDRSLMVVQEESSGYSMCERHGGAVVQLSAFDAFEAARISAHDA